MIKQPKLRNKMKCCSLRLLGSLFLLSLCPEREKAGGQIEVFVIPVNPDIASLSNSTLDLVCGKCLGIRLELLGNTCRLVGGWVVQNVPWNVNRTIIRGVKIWPFYDPMITAAPYWHYVCVHVCVWIDFNVLLLLFCVCFYFYYIFYFPTLFFFIHLRPCFSLYCPL